MKMTAGAPGSNPISWQLLSSLPSLLSEGSELLPQLQRPSYGARLPLVASNLPAVGELILEPFASAARLRYQRGEDGMSAR